MAGEQQKDQYKRQPAVVVQISDIHASTFVKPGGWEPNYMQTPFGEKVSRVNVMAVVVEPPVVIEGMTQFSCTVDDGTGKIQVRAFEPVKTDGSLDMGTSVIIIGRPREYNKSYYILPEAIRPIEKDWLEYRKKEVASFNRVAAVEVDMGDELESPVVEDTPQTLLDAIETKDNGDGASVEELSAEDPTYAEKISKLLLHGEIYEVKPGRIKVLK